jgi:hypothetical protein
MNLIFNFSEEKVGFKELFSVLNPDLESGKIDYLIFQLLDSCAICQELATEKVEKIIFSLTEEGAKITERNEISINDFVKEHFSLIENSVLEETKVALENTQTENLAFSQKIVDLEKENSTLKIENETLVDTYSAEREGFTNKITSLEKDLSELVTFKLDVEQKQKTAVIDSYAHLLDEETRESFKSEMDKYSLVELDMHLTYAVKTAKPSLFTIKEDKQEKTGLIAKDNTLDGIGRILSRYEN